MKKVILISILVLVAVLVSGCIDLATSCESNTYSTCPDNCEKQCVPSEDTGKMMTSDCDGSGSCVTPEEKLIGGDRDENGCLTSAGYTWCESSKTCIRKWETLCQGEEAEILPEDCEAQGGTVVNLAGDDIKCPEGSKVSGEVIGFFSLNMCCVPSSSSFTTASDCDIACKIDGYNYGECKESAVGLDIYMGGCLDTMFTNCVSTESCGCYCSVE
jgi:hypothetical protein